MMGALNYVEYTEKTIDSYGSDKKILVVGPGYNIKRNNVVINENNVDLVEWIEKYRNSENFALFDVVLLFRVLEHLEVRKIDWYIFNLYTIMKKKAIMHCIVPNMWHVCEELHKEFKKLANKEAIDDFKTRRLTYELFSEGKDTFWRHSLWTDEYSVQYYLEQEKLFHVLSVTLCKEIIINSSIVPYELEIICERL